MFFFTKQKQRLSWIRFCWSIPSKKWQRSKNDQQFFVVRVLSPQKPRKGLNFEKADAKIVDVPSLKLSYRGAIASENRSWKMSLFSGRFPFSCGELLTSMGSIPVHFLFLKGLVYLLHSRWCIFRLGWSFSWVFFSIPTCKTTRKKFSLLFPSIEQANPSVSLCFD